MATHYNVVVISPAGVIIGVERYNPATRPTSVKAAADLLANRLRLTAPEFRNFATDSLGNEWGKMIGEFEVGMIEIGMGKWGRAQVEEFNAPR